MRHIGLAVTTGLLLILAPGCKKDKTAGGPDLTAVDLTDATAELSGPGDIDGGRREDAMRTDTAPEIADVAAPDETRAQDGFELVEPDVHEIVEPTCLEPPPGGEYLNFEPAVGFEDQGVNSYEQEVFQILSEAVLTSPSIYFVTTYLFQEETYLVKWAGGHFKFKRTFGAAGPEFEVVEQEGEDPFKCTDPAGFNTYESELAAYENPMGTSCPELGYEEGDPRVGFIEADKHCYPWPLLRIAQFYDSPNAPDFHYSYTPWGVGGGGSHGALDVLQSRSPFIVAGKGIKKGFDDQETAMIVDLAPTVLYLMGAQPEPGLKHGLEHDTTYLKWQDGRPITSMLEQGCVEPFKYVFILLFDGLESNEIVHLYESKEVELPAFFDIMDQATIFRNGAIVGFPTVSVPGHLSLGTGMFNGHHFFLNNGFYYRKDDLVVAPGDIMAKAEEYLANPEMALELFDFIFNPLGETMFEAAHRHFGDNVFAASVNELTLIGADHNLVDMARAFGDLRTDYFELADQLAVPQILTVLDEQLDSGKPLLFYVSFYTTDHQGEAVGPHGNKLRETLENLDGYLSVFLDKLDEEGIRDQSVIIITADHGMELQDKNRSSNWKVPLQETGLKYKDPDGYGLVYIPVMRVECSADCDEECSVLVTVTSDDTLLPVEGALVSEVGSVCDDCSVVTDDAGKTELMVLAPPFGETLEIQATHDSFNTATVVCWGP